VALGARVSVCWPLSDRSGVAETAAQSEAVEEAALDAAIATVVGDAGGIDLLAVDGAGLFAHVLERGGDGRVALRACMEAAWSATRATVNHAFLAPAVGAESQGGRIVYLAPVPDAECPEIVQHAAAACAGLENLARTLSTEWARYGITTVAIAPGAGTAAGEVGALVAYLASRAGAYFSGCLLDLRGPDPRL
jgi:NAD(P)-dependent dehydrogenase (short-subunit alcohol dehydrogenase family)